jgi:hypothetical protein
VKIENLEKKVGELARKLNVGIGKPPERIATS